MQGPTSYGRDRGFCDIRTSGSPLKGEGSLRPCPLGAMVVQESTSRRNMMTSMTRSRCSLTRAEPVERTDETTARKESATLHLRHQCPGDKSPGRWVRMAFSTCTGPRAWPAEAVQVHKMYGPEERRGSGDAGTDRGASAGRKVRALANAAGGPGAGYVKAKPVLRTAARETPTILRPAWRPTPLHAGRRGRPRKESTTSLGSRVGAPFAS
jgi:hypothetical protein